MKGEFNIQTFKQSTFPDDQYAFDRANKACLHPPTHIYLPFLGEQILAQQEDLWPE